MLKRCAFLAAALAVGTNVPAATADCDRSCLKSALDQYLNAIVKHDPSAAPLFVGFRQTENAMVVRNGTGLWKSIGALGDVQRRFFDPISSQAAYFGTIQENGSSAVVTARIKVDQKRITEAEWYIARRGDPGLNGPVTSSQTGGVLFDPEYLAKNPPPERVVPKADRLSRESLAAITNSYFDGITTHDGSIILAHKGCTRMENGAKASGGRGGSVVGDCTSGLATINIQNVTARRYPVIDEEAQAVLAMAVFLRKPGTPQRRNVFSEWFFIDQQKIRSIYSAMFYPDSLQPVPNWPPYEGNWPLPDSLASH